MSRPAAFESVAYPSVVTAKPTPARLPARERGPSLDARAWLSIRGWVDPVVKVTLADEKDPTPYWLVSTRRPEDLKAARER